MKVAIFGRGISIAILDELINVANIIQESYIYIPTPQEVFILDNFVESTPFVDSYQSRNERPIIWEASLKQFYRMCTYHA
jgi:hypothetical protein